ncbi:hypothetical protein LTR85_009787 [Meristemomyces frigidus]|nr:hypothetical protein LTR85_009787 [Meristemomyces frigidus]
MSLLLDLPRELRELIYHRLFAAGTYDIRSKKHLPGILTVCRQLRTESFTLFFALTIFRFGLECYGEIERQLRCFAHMPQEHFTSIRSFEIRNVADMAMMELVAKDIGPAAVESEEKRLRGDFRQAFTQAGLR